MLLESSVEAIEPKTNVAETGVTTREWFFVQYFTAVYKSAFLAVFWISFWD